MVLVMSLHKLTRTQSIEQNPTTFVQRSKAFAGSSMATGAHLVVLRDQGGLHSFLQLPDRGRDDGAAQAINLAQAVGARADRVEPGSPDHERFTRTLRDSSHVGWLESSNDQVFGRDTQSGTDPAELSRLLARSMSPGMWAAISLRQATGAERKRWVAWLCHRMGTVNPTHHSVGREAMVASVVVGGDDRSGIDMLLRSLGAGLPGFDVATRERVVHERAPLVQAIWWGVLALVGLVGSTFLSGLDPLVAEHLGGQAQRWWPLVRPGVSVLLLCFLAFAVVKGLLAWRGAGQGWLDRLATGRLVLPPRHTGRVRPPRKASTKMVEGQLVETPEFAGDYPLDRRGFMVGPEVVTGLVAPQAGAASGEQAARTLHVPAALLERVGPMVGSSDQGPVHLSAADFPYGVAVTGKPGSGKTKLVVGLWAWATCDRVGPCGLHGSVGSRNAMVFFDSKGDEVEVLQRWGALIGDRVLVVDVGDETTPAIDFFGGDGSVVERAETFVNAMVYGFSDGAIGDSSAEVLQATLAGGLAADRQVVDMFNAESGLDPLPADASPVLLAHVLNGGRGEPAGMGLFSIINSEAMRLAATGDRSPRALDLEAAAAKLRPFYLGPSEAQRRTKLEPGRNKLNQLTNVEFWFSASRPKLSWEQVLDQHLSVVVNLGRSASGRLLDEKASHTTSAMMMFLLQRAIAQRCGGWMRQGRAVSIFSDELAMQAGHSESVLTWLRDQGRSYGVRLFLATQRPEQLSPLVRTAFLTFAALVSLAQSEATAAAQVADQLGMSRNEWSGEQIMSLPRFHAAVRVEVNAERQPAFTMRIPEFEADMEATVRGWGFTPRPLSDRSGVVSTPVPAPAVPGPDGLVSAAVVDDPDGDGWGPLVQAVGHWSGTSTADLDAPSPGGPPSGWGL